VQSPAAFSAVTQKPATAGDKGFIGQGPWKAIKTQNISALLA